MPKKSALEPWYEFNLQAEQGTAELKIFGPIGGGFFDDEDAPTGKRVAAELDELGDDIDTIRVLVNSPGGNVFDAVHIANALRRQREEGGRAVEVDVEALAASAATIITSAGNPIRMPRNALMMVHNPSTVAIGNAEEMRSLAGALDRLKNTIIATYRWVSKLSAKKLGKLMDETTWMEASEALENGFATEIVEPVKAVASLGRGALEHLEIPDEYRNQILALIEPEPSAQQAREPMPKKIVTVPAATPAPVPAPVSVAPAPVAALAPVASAQPAPVAPSPAPTTAAQALTAAVKTAERDRLLAIQNASNVAVVAGLDPTMACTISTNAITLEHTIEQARAAFFEALAKPGAGPGVIPPDIHGIEEERDKRIAGMCAALWNRAGKLELIRKAVKKNPDHPEFQNVELDPAEFRGMSLIDFCRESLERDKAGSSSGLVKMELAGKFLNQGGQQTTSDFAVALEEALNKLLLAAYTTLPDKWRRFCSIGSVTDFRAHNRYRQGFLSRLEVLLEGGEIQNKRVPDVVKEIQQAKTFANILALSRVAIVNDDMGVFNTVATTLGRAAGLSIELEVFDSLALNSNLGPDMNDGNPLFDASHNNIATGAALSVASVDADRVIMAQQTDPSGNEILDLRPAVLLIPIGLGGAANVLNRSEFDNDGTALMKPNAVVGLYRDIVDTGRITGTRRYSFADPADAPTFEVAFLEGQQEPFMEMKDGWRTDGVEWKVRHDFGVAAIDFRGAVTNAGV